MLNPTSTLTQREIDVIHLIIKEYSSKQIADQLYISFETVRTHRKRIINKLNVKSTAGLVRRALELGIVELEAIV